MSALNLLLADDEVSFVETMSKRLTKRNLKVATALAVPMRWHYLKKMKELTW
jgi:hypothetical protein